jgi:hypothetical protein
MKACVCRPKTSSTRFLFFSLIWRSVICRTPNDKRGWPDPNSLTSLLKLRSLELHCSALPSLSRVISPVQGDTSSVASNGDLHTYDQMKVRFETSALQSAAHGTAPAAQSAVAAPAPDEVNYVGSSGSTRHTRRTTETRGAKVPLVQVKITAATFATPKTT